MKTRRRYIRFYIDDLPIRLFQIVMKSNRHVLMNFIQSKLPLPLILIVYFHPYLIFVSLLQTYTVV